MKNYYTSLAALLLLSVTSYSQDKKACLKFDGDDDKVVVDHHNSLNLGRSAFTIEAWIAASPNMTTNSVLAPTVVSKKGAGSSSTDGFLFGLTDKGKMAIQMEGLSISVGGPGGGWGTGVTAVDLRDGACHHIAWTREVGGVEDTVNAYQDAAYVKKSRKAAGKKDIDNMEDLWIGASEFNTSANTYQYEGQIKEIRIWNFAKTEAQIFDDRYKHMTGSESGLIFYWRLNENSGTTVYDCGPNGRNGTVDGAVWETYVCDNMDAIPSPNNCMPAGPSGLKDARNLVDVTVYPNPVKDEIRLISDEQFNMDLVTIYDLNGKLILQKNWNGTQALNVSDLNMGTYLIQLSNDNEILYRSIMTKE